MNERVPQREQSLGGDVGRAVLHVIDQHGEVAEVAAGLLPALARERGPSGGQPRLVGQPAHGPGGVGEDGLKTELGVHVVALPHVVVADPILRARRQFVGGKHGDEVREGEQCVRFLPGQPVGAREAVFGLGTQFVGGKLSKPRLKGIDALFPGIFLGVGAGHGQFDARQEGACGKGAGEIREVRQRVGRLPHFEQAHAQKKLSALGEGSLWCEQQQIGHGRLRRREIPHLNARAQNLI